MDRKSVFPAQPNIRELTEKYDYRVPMYTEYPHRDYWTEISEKELKGVWRRFLLTEPETSFLLYVHILYCLKACWYCTCHFALTHNYKDVKQYLDLLFREFDHYSSFFDGVGTAPRIREVHLGGGSPTILHEEEFEALMKRIRMLAGTNEVVEFAIEIDPRHVKEDMARFYAKQGVRRLSLGVQDFDPEVLEAVNRPQPEYLTERLLAPELRKLFPRGVNIDLICGLPCQTPESMQRTIRKTIELAPDRICLNYMDYKPEIVPHQRLMPQDRIPNGYERKVLFLTALEMLEGAGYVRTGYDHFALPSDDVSQAMKEGKMIWNSLGVTPGRCEDILGLGVHSYSRIGPRYYFQNLDVEDLLEYDARVTRGKLPVWRGHIMSSDDLVRRAVIQKLRSYFALEYREIETEFGVDFRDYFRQELKALEKFETDGIVTFTADGIAITDFGEQFANLICREFDAYHTKYTK